MNGYPFDGICANTTFVLESRDPDVLLPDLLPFLMLTDDFTQHSMRESKGSVNPYINWKDIAKYEFLLPPKDGQRRIAQILGEADRHLEGLRSSSRDVEEVRRAVLLRVYTRGIGHSGFQVTPIGPRPKTWEVAELQKHYEVQLGKMISPKARKGNHQRPYVRNANVQWNRLDLADLAMMSFSPTEVERFELRHGDILACEGRHVGKSAIWRNEIPGACYQKALHRLRALDEQQVPEFMLYQMEFASLTGRFLDTTGETTIPHLPAERLRTILFAFPPRAEQAEIAETVGMVNKAKAAIQRQMETAREMVRRLATRLLRG